jgi:PAS domain-containing protein
MADKKWQTGGGIMIPAGVVVCLIASIWAVAVSGVGSSLVRYFNAADPEVVSDVVLGGLVVCSFLIAIGLWVASTLRRVKRSKQSRNAFVSSALNNLKQGVVITNTRKRIVFLNDRYLEIYGLSRSDITLDMTGRDLLDLRRQRGILDISTDDFYAQAGKPDGLITELPGGKSVHVKYFSLPNGGSVATHEDCSEQRELSRQLASTKQFLESVLENVPVCVAAKSIEDGRYIFANRAFERFSRFSRSFIVGKRADEIFTPDTAAGIEAADRAALNMPDGQFRN